jgi:hypothetical protein
MSSLVEAWRDLIYFTIAWVIMQGLMQSGARCGIHLPASGWADCGLHSDLSRR